MKTIFLAALATISFGVSAQTSKCPHKILETTGTIIVVPVYKTNVTYFFNNEDKEAFAKLEWKPDEGRTSACFHQIQQANPDKKLTIPPMRMPDFEVEILGSNERHSLRVYPSQGGQYFGSLSFIPVNYRSKAAIEKAVREKRELVVMNGEFAFGYDRVTRKVVASVDCTRDAQQGVPALHKRLGEVINQIKSITDARIDNDQVLEMFMGSCVQLSDSDSESLSYLSRKVKLVKGIIPVEGSVSEWTKEVVGPFTDLEASIVSDKE